MNTVSNEDDSAGLPAQPFPGLRPFEPEEADLFHGRAHHVVDLISRLQKSPFLAVVGGSGSGKSSLVRAGLLPTLTKGYLLDAGADWRFIVMKPGNDPFRSLARAMRESGGPESPSPREVASTDALLRASHYSFTEALSDADDRETPDPRPVLLLVDQFEELFRFRHRHLGGADARNRSRSERRNEATGFVNLLLATAEQSATTAEQSDTPSRFPVYVLLTMRSDFIGDCDAFEGLPEAVSDHQYLVPRLTREQIRDAIEKPLRLFGAQAEPGLANRIINEAGTDPDQLPLMQHALMRTWMRSGGEGKTLAVTDYEEEGGIRNALNKHADMALNTEGVDSEIARILFLCLCHHETTGQIVRREATIAEVAAVAGVNPEEVYPVVRAFQEDHRHFIVSYDPPDEFHPGTLLDISHEALLRQWTKLEDWIKKESESVVDYRWLVDAAGKKGTKSDNFEPLGGVDLKRAEDWKEDRKPNEAWAARHDSFPFGEAMEYLSESRTAEDDRVRNEEKQRKFRARAITAVLIVIAGLAVLMFFAERKARRAEAKALAAQLQALGALRDEQGKLVQAWMYSLEELDGQKDPSRATPRTVGRLASIGWEQAFASSQVSFPESALAISRDETLLGAGIGNKVAVWNLKNGVPLPLLLGHKGLVRSLSFSIDDRWLASGCEAGKVRVWDIKAPWKAPRVLDAKGGTMDDVYVHAVQFSGDGSLLAAGTSEGEIWIWDAASFGTPVKRTAKAEYGSVRGLAFTKAGSLVAKYSKGFVGEWTKNAGIWSDPPKEAEWAAGRWEHPPEAADIESMEGVVVSDPGRWAAGVNIENESLLVWEKRRGEWERIGVLPDPTREGTDEPALPSSVEKIAQLAAAGDGVTLAAGYGDSGGFEIWRQTGSDGGWNKTPVLEWLLGVKNGGWNKTPVLEPKKPLKSVALGGDGKLIALGRSDGTVEVRKTVDPAKNLTFTRLSSSPQEFTFLGKRAPDGQTNAVHGLAFWGAKRLVAAEKEGTVRWWEIAEEEDGVFSVKGDSPPRTAGSPAKSVTFFGTREKVAAGFESGSVRLWETSKDGDPKEQAMHAEAISDLVYSSTNEILFSSSYDGTVRWTNEAGDKTGTLSGPGPEVRVWCVDVSPDGQWIAGGTQEGAIYLWKREGPGQPEAIWIADRDTDGDRNKRILGVQFIHGGDYLVSGGDGGLHTWDLRLLKAYLGKEGRSAPEFRDAYRKSDEAFGHWWSEDRLDLVELPPRLFSGK